MKVQKNQILWLALFSIAMGYLEAAVVVYLRAIYYPNGFDFPLLVMSPHHVLVELLREAATVIMLAGVGILAGKTVNQRFAFFLVAFSIWDIFYYVFLKLLVDWPESIFTWDILFLIPVPWIGPVLAPVLISITMLILAIVLVRRDRQNSDDRIQRVEWSLLTIGSLIVILSWTLDYWNISFGKNVSGTAAMLSFSEFIPSAYRWWMFWIGELFLIGGIFIFWKRTKLSPSDFADLR